MPSADSYSAIICEFCKDRRTEKAIEYYNKMLECGLTPSDFAYRALIGRYCEEHKTEEATQLLNDMQQKGYVPDFATYWALISGLSNTGEKSNPNKSSVLGLFSGIKLHAK